ncbi:MAG: hydroxyisourate hydrolase [Pseudomonadota bacterium]
MAQVTSHTLNGTDGSHADGIPVRLIHLPTATVMLEQATADGGRLSMDVDTSAYHRDDEYELMFDTGVYWSTLHQPRQHVQIMRKVVLRFFMPDNQARYHMPVIINPNSYSCWWSAPE